MARFISNGQGNCFGFVLKVGYEVIINCESYFSPCAEEEADVVGFYGTDGSLEHVCRVVKKEGSLIDWLLESKTSLRSGRYRHTTRELVEGFPVCSKDAGYRFSGLYGANIQYDNPAPLKIVAFPPK